MTHTDHHARTERKKHCNRNGARVAFGRLSVHESIFGSAGHLLRLPLTISGKDPLGPGFKAFEASGLRFQLALLSSGQGPGPRRLAEVSDVEWWPTAITVPCVAGGITHHARARRDVSRVNLGEEVSVSSISFRVVQCEVRMYSVAGCEEFGSSVRGNEHGLLLRASRRIGRASFPHGTPKRDISELLSSLDCEVFRTRSVWFLCWRDADGRIWVDGFGSR